MAPSTTSTDGAVLHEIVVAAATLFVWGTTLSFGGITAFWLAAVLYLGRQFEPGTNRYGPDDIQVRILTIDEEQVVQATVDSLPDGLTDRHVVAETAIDIDGATVHVVPEDFGCDAVRKGRAIEWARRHVTCDKEYVLYLDEDSLVSSSDGLPDADIVQIQERPRRTGSFFTYLAEIYRVGVQLEQRAFSRFSVPLFAWGGGSPSVEPSRTRSPGIGRRSSKTRPSRGALPSGPTPTTPSRTPCSPTKHHLRFGRYSNNAGAGQQAITRKRTSCPDRIDC